MSHTVALQRYVISNGSGATLLMNSKNCGFQVESTTPMAWIEEAIKKHNEYRALHGVDPLVYNKTVTKPLIFWGFTTS